jgi:hypothetical protein
LTHQLPEAWKEYKRTSNWRVLFVRLERAGPLISLLAVALYLGGYRMWEDCSLEKFQGRGSNDILCRLIYLFSWLGSSLLVVNAVLLARYRRERLILGCWLPNFLGFLAVVWSVLILTFGAMLSQDSKKTGTDVILRSQPTKNPLSVPASQSENSRFLAPHRMTR